MEPGPVRDDADTGSTADPRRSAGRLTDPVPAGDSELYRLVVDAVPDAVIVTASDGRILVANRKARELFGYDEAGATLVDRDVDELLPQSLRKVHAHHRGRYIEHPRAREMGSGLELLALRADGSEVPVEVSLSPVEVDGAHYVVAAIRDLSVQRAAQASLNATRDRLALTAERERIGRDLHDSVIQRLYGAGLAMQAALDAEPERLRTAVNRSVGEIDDTIAEIRTVIHDLRRDDAEVDRLDERLHIVAEAQAAALGVPVRLHVADDGSVEPPAPVADAVLAVVREGIANAHRHGRARHIDVDVDAADGRLVVTVRDDGVGFDPSVEADGYGLKNLRARAIEFGGRFRVDSKGASGTQLFWEIPLA